MTVRQLRAVRETVVRYMALNRLDARVRIAALVSLAIITPLGFLSKFYRGPGQLWANNSLGGLLYEVFWCLVVFVFLPRARPAAIAVWVFLITSALETLQLWHPWFLQAVRRTFIGATLIGTTFVWGDFFYYAVGCGAGFLVLRLIVIRSGGINAPGKPSGS